MRSVGAGTIQCDDPRIKKQPLEKSYNAFCFCKNDWDTQMALDVWTNPLTDCVRQECLDQFAAKVKQARKTCKVFPAGPYRTACEIAARALEEAAKEVCDYCRN